jgi:transcriptional regulator with XRE-family HTH domain
MISHTGETKSDPVEARIAARIAARLAALRLAHALSLDDLAARTGLSRATLSRIERAETSPTAAMLGRLCAAYGWTLSRLMADAEGEPPALRRAADQPEWTDPETGFRRRAVSPPAPGLRIELVAAVLPAGRAIAYPAPPVAAMEQHLRLEAGALDFTHGPDTWRLAPGDVLRLRLTGPTRLAAPGPDAARCLIAIAAP